MDNALVNHWLRLARKYWDRGQFDLSRDALSMAEAILAGEDSPTQVDTFPPTLADASV